jgi:hypothetical protein
VTASFADVAAKLEGGEPLSDTDVQMLEADRDIVALGRLADAERRKRHGTQVTFLRVADLSQATVGPGFSPADIPSAAGEVRITAAPATLEEAVTIVASACDAANGILLSAFSLADLEGFREPLPVTLKALKDAGLEMVAFAPLDRLKHPERSLEAVTDAGLIVGRVTVDEVPSRKWSDVCRQLAAIQRKIQSLRVFAPLPRKVDVTQPTTGYEDVKRVVLSRLLADNVDTIQVDWALYGPKLAQVALMFGADDIDSVSPEDDDSQGRRRSPLEEIRRSIQSAGFEAGERNARFELRG